VGGGLGDGGQAGWWAFLTEVPRSLGVRGGIGSVLVSTGMILAVCLGVALPLGLGTAVLLTETGATRGDARLARAVRRSLDVLAGVPSIVFGLFGSVLFCEVMGMGFSIKAGGLTLACMVLPIFIRAAEEGLRGVPESWRQGATALGLSRAAALRRVVLPAALPGLAVAFVLGVGRALAETAALLFTAGTVTRMPESLGDSGRALSVHIYTMAMEVNGGRCWWCCCSGLIWPRPRLGVSTPGAWPDRVSLAGRHRVIRASNVSMSLPILNPELRLTTTPEAMPSEPLLRACCVSVSYGGKPAVRDVELEIARGRITAIIGPSGCGKSSFLASLNRLTDLIGGCTVSGAAMLEGHDLLAPDVDPVALRRRVGMIFQKPNPFAMSIRKNLEMPLKANGVRSAADRRDLAEAALRDVGLWDEVSAPWCCGPGCCCSTNPAARWTRWPPNASKSC